MMRMTLKFILLSLAILGMREIYAKDYYVYCRAEFASKEYSPRQEVETYFGIEDTRIVHYNPPRNERVILYSPIFKINLSEGEGAHLSDGFVKTILKDLRVKGTFVYENITNKRGVIEPDRWCTVGQKFTSLNKAKKYFDQDYESSKNTREKLNLGYMGIEEKIEMDRCKAIGIYVWTPENQKALYPIQKSDISVNEALVQRCDPNEAPRYK